MIDYDSILSKYQVVKINGFFAMLSCRMNKLFEKQFHLKEKSIMSKLTAEGIEQIRQEKSIRKANLNQFMSQPFAPSNEEQLKILRKYSNEFEFTLNQMYLFQAMSTGITAWGSSWLVGMLLPIPEFANYILSSFLYLGITGYILQKFNTTDFYNQLEEMKALYNWALKDGSDSYDGKTDNIEKLNTPEIQHMIKLMAPLCSLEFMQAWPKITEKHEVKTGFRAVYDVGQQLYGRFFSTTPEPSDKLKPLQTMVETGALSINTMEGLEQAIRYFTTSTYCRELFKGKLQQPLEQLKGMLPELVTSAFSHPKIS